MFITIFTPTFNRAYTLGRLHESLMRQSFCDFEWVIVDDGSTDGTSDMVRQWTESSPVHIRYYYQDNSGKPAAHNRGVALAEGDLFCCVDSDDYLKDDALKEIWDFWNAHAQENNIGLLAFRQAVDGTPITQLRDRVSECTLHDAYKHHGLKNDTMLVFRTSAVSKYDFPIINGEKFIPEGYLYNKLDRDGTLLVFPEYLYLCEYQKDGYTANVSKLLYDNWKSYVLHINTRIRNVDTPFERLLDSIRYDAIMMAREGASLLRNAESKLFAILGIAPGFVLYCVRYRKFRKSCSDTCIKG